MFSLFFCTGTKLIEESEAKKIFFSMERKFEVKEKRI